MTNPHAHRSNIYAKQEEAGGAEETNKKKTKRTKTKDEDKEKHYVTEYFHRLIIYLVLNETRIFRGFTAQDIVPVWSW